MSRSGSETPLLGELLESVSRSFYLTLKTLPEDVREPIGLAYLLARASDTIADTDAVPAELRLISLDRFQERCDEEGSGWAMDFEVQDLGVSQGECALLGRLSEAFGLLDAQQSASKEEIRRVLRTIVAGQRSDIERFELEGPLGSPRALKNESELDTYIYQVAGSVGEFWTRLCGAERLDCSEDDFQERVRLGVRYGKGLQLINILRDMRPDWARGRVYLPEDALAARGVQVRDLDTEGAWDAWRDYYRTLLGRARGYLDDGWYYVSQIPFRERRLRLATALPALIGRDTLSKMDGRWPFDQTPVKVSRSLVYRRLAQTFIAVGAPVFWRGLWNLK